MSTTTLFRLAYDGTDFHGFAWQPPRPDGSALRTVQGDVEAALAKVLQRQTTLRFASRTDAGVHARGQLAAMDTPPNIPLEGLRWALHNVLPRDISLGEAWNEPGEVHPRFSNLGKEYRYTLLLARMRDPLCSRFEWHVGRALNLDAMAQAADAFEGTHDFSSFRTAACQAKTSVRTVESVQVQAHENADRAEIIVRGQAFLHNMVRIMVGSLVDVGLGRRDPAWIAQAIAACNRQHAGPTAPAHGLCLHNVRWRPQP